MSRTCHALLLTMGMAACDDEVSLGYKPLLEGKCQIESGAAVPSYLERIDCSKDFLALASTPLGVGLPAGPSVNIVLDTQNGGSLYFQNSSLYPYHYDFIKANLGDPGLLNVFNEVTYYQPTRRFIVGAVTRYPMADVWALELAPYDTASMEMINKLYRTVQQATWFGPKLVFHPTSDSMEAEAQKLPSSVLKQSTAQLFAAIDYQPLSLGRSIGFLRFTTAAQASTECYPYDQILVLDEAPDRIGAVRGVITQEFQPTFSHINLLSQNCKTPNVGLRRALTHEKLKPLDGKLVELTVGASEWSIREATQAELSAYEAAHPRASVTLPAVDPSATVLTNVEDVTVETGQANLRADLLLATNRFGAKSAHYSILAKTEGVTSPAAFAIPNYYYEQFMRENGFYAQIDGWLTDSEFNGSADLRRQRMLELREAMAAAPLNQAFQAELTAKLAAEYPGTVMRFAPSTNGSDLDGLPCAGCYQGHSADPTIAGDVARAVRQTWASAWDYCSFETRRYFNVVHESLGVGLLVQPAFSDEEASGTALTNNPFDPKQLDPAFYVDVQWGGEVTTLSPPSGVVRDILLYYYYSPGYPAHYLSHSNLVAEGSTVLTRTQLHDLGVALEALHTRFRSAYQMDPTRWYGMDVEFKFDDEGDATRLPALQVIGVRPHPAVDVLSWGG